MHIGHDLSTGYTMKEGNKIIKLNSTEEEKDLGVLISSDMKFHEQCVQSAKKAQSVLDMVKRHFKIDEDNFTALYKIYIRPHLEYSIQAWSPHLKNDIECLERIQRRATKVVKGLRKKTYEERLKVSGIY